MAKMNVMCAVPDCKNAVIGQCQGYRGESCGRFFCREHSEDGLCAVHVVQRLEGSKYAEYDKVARGIGGTVKWRGLVPLLIWGAVAASACLPLFFLISNQVDSPAKTNEQVDAVMQPYLFLWVLIFGVGGGIWYWRQRRRLEKVVVAEKSVGREDFTEFYEVWRAKKRKDELALLGGLLLAGAAATIVAAASSIAEDERSGAKTAEEDARVQYEVDRELKRRGLD